jgi:pimeloyl-ACP methyl ester carboxylesterase
MIEFTPKSYALSPQISISYIDTVTSNKPILLFLHGLANYWQVWQFNVAALQKNFRCIAIDLPGNGLSSRGNFVYDMNFYIETIVQFCSALKLKKVSLVGHSMGGHIACKIALAQPKLIERLVLCAPSGFEFYASHEVVLVKSAMQMGQWMAQDEGHLSQSIRSSFYQSSPISKIMIEELTKLIQDNDRNSYRKMIERSMNAMMDEPIFSSLKKIEQPTLVFFGEWDELIPNKFFHPTQTARDVAIKACNELPQARLITYPETGHFVQIEQAQKMNDEILFFMTNTKS